MLFVVVHLLIVIKNISTHTETTAILVPSNDQLVLVT